MLLGLAVWFGVSSTAGAQEPAPAPTPEPDAVDLLDVLAPVHAALDHLESRGVGVGPRELQQDALRGPSLHAALTVETTALVVYVLERVAADGYQILLEPTGPGTLMLRAWTSRGGQARGVAFVGLTHVDLRGRFRPGETAGAVGPLVGLGGVAPPQLLPVDLEAELRNLGYRTDFRARDLGGLEIVVEPARTIRRVRIRGNGSLPRRKVRRGLTLEAQPGGIARGACTTPAQARSPARALCAPGDAVCQEWERTELERLRELLFDEGFLRGKAHLGLSCGRDAGEADLWVMIDHGPAWRPRAREVDVAGNVDSRDARWVRRVFRPTVSPFLPLPKRLTRRHLEQAKETVAREYAEPRSRGTGSRDLRYPYPGVRVETNVDRMDPATYLTRPPSTGRQRLRIDVQLGPGVQVDLLGNDRVGDTRLLRQLRLFQRREPPAPGTATREAENLRWFYQTRGFPLATVSGSMPDFGGNSVRRLVFRVKEGPRARIRDLQVPAPSGVPAVLAREITKKWSRKRKLRRQGTFADADAREDLAALLGAWNDAGYLCATAEIDVAFTPDGLRQKGAHAQLDLSSAFDRPGAPSWLERQLDARGLEALRKLDRVGLWVAVRVQPGPRVLTSGRERVLHLEQPIPSSRNLEGLPTLPSGWGAARIFRDGPLRRRGDERPSGIPVTPGLSRDVERDVVQRYRAGGHPIADAAVGWIHRGRDGTQVRAPTAERLAAPETGMCRDNAGASVALVDTELAVYEGRRAVFGTTLVRGNFKTRSWVLRRELRREWKPGDPYDGRRIQRAARRIDGTGVADGVDIAEKPVGCEHGAPGTCKVHEVVTMREGKDVAVQPRFGAGGATIDPFYVFLRPVFPNLFGTAWDLTLDGHWGFNPKGLGRVLCDAEACYERSARGSLVRRRIFATPLTLSLNGSVQERATPARGRIDSALGEVRVSWPISDEWQIYGSYLIQLANISKDVVKPTSGGGLGCGPDGLDPCPVTNRGESIVPDRTGALQTGVMWQRIDNAFNPKKGFMASVDAMLASPWLGGWDWWARIDASWQHFIPIPRTRDRLGLRYSLRYGHAIPIRSGPGTHTTSVPEVWRYYGGGTLDLGIRGLLPNTMLVDLEEVQDGYGFVRLRPVAIGGHIRALGTVAMQVVSLQNIFGGQLAHSLFFDFGVLAQRWEQVQFPRDIRRSVGVNFLKFDIDLLTIAVGYAILLPGNRRPTDDPNGRFVFDVGVTF